MSICRWSSNNWDCDLYCYEDYCGGITTHVASNRIVGDIPRLPLMPIGKDSQSDEWKQWFAAYKEQSDFIDKAEYTLIGLRYDGESFSDYSWESFLERITNLRNIGYHVPDFVFDEANESIKNGEEVYQGV
jgi:hypothetical protein